MEEGKKLSIVDESGCGKSTMGRVILKLLESTDGKIIFDGEDITKFSRGKMQMIFQDPFSSFDPRQTVSQLIAEPIIEHRLIKGKTAIEKRTLELRHVL